MKYRTVLAALCIACAATIALADDSAQSTNPAIDMQAFLRVSLQAAAHRESRRLSEEEFARMSRDSGVVVLDARSKQKYDELHIKGAVNLSFPDIAIESLARLIPDKDAVVLIYCNNNFSAADGPFP